MARHRDIRNMDYTDDYDGYDDVYGHSLDEDYYISPSNRQFVYNREASRDGRFEHEDDIQEVDEVEELSDIDKAKLQSCIDQIKDTLGTTTVPRNELVNLILKYKFNVELVVNALLEDAKFESNTGLKEKDVAQFSSTKFTIPRFHSTNLDILENKQGAKINMSPHNYVEQNSSPDKAISHSSNSKVFTIPNVFGPKIEANTEDSTLNIKNFNIPNIFSSKSDQSNLSPKNVNIPHIFNTKTETNLEPTYSNTKNINISDTNTELSNLVPKNPNITDLFNLKTNSNTELSQSSPKNFNTPNILKLKTDSNSETSNLCSKNFNIPNIFNSKTNSNTEISNSSPKNFNIPNIFNSKTDSGIELTYSSPKNFNTPNIFNSKTDSNTELSNSVPKNFNIPKIFDSKPDSNPKLSTSSPKNFNIPNIFNSKPDSNTELNRLSPKNFNVPKIFNSPTQSNFDLSSSSPKHFTIPNIFHSQADQFGRSGSNTSTQIISSESDKEFISLSELVNSHLKNSLPADSLLQGNDTNEINTISTKMSNVVLSEPKSFSTNDIRNNLNIDLTKAIKTVGSLPSFSKSKENIPEKFEIPFIDCDTVVKTDKTTLNTRKRLSCNLDIRNILNQSVYNFKKPSKLGKVICRRYRNLKSKIIVPERQVIPSKVKIFSFNTISPDDFISSHLKKQ